MMNDLWPVLVQTVLILLALFASFVNLRERITALETTSKHQGTSIDRMTDQVHGLSQHVAKLDAKAQPN